MPKAPFRLSKKWLSSPSQRFHGPPRSESQALLRKAFFAFAAHSQGGLSPGCPLHPRSQSGGQGRAPGRAGGGGVWRPGAFGPRPAKPKGWAGAKGPRPIPLRALRALPPPPPAGRPPNAPASRRRRAVDMRCRSPHSSGQTYRPLPLVFSPYWMAWTGQRLMQLVQR